jgi:hypothetical protein
LGMLKLRRGFTPTAGLVGLNVESLRNAHPRRSAHDAHEQGTPGPVRLGPNRSEKLIKPWNDHSISFLN